jgi:hypothetical protein
VSDGSPDKLKVQILKAEKETNKSTNKGIYSRHIKTFTNTY